MADADGRSGMMRGRSRRGGMASGSSIVPNAMPLGVAKRMPSSSSAIRNTVACARRILLYYERSPEGVGV